MQKQVILFLILCVFQIRSQQSSFIDYAPTAFVNYGETVHAQPARAYYPHNLQELQQAVNDARTANVKIRAIGKGHTFSDIIISNGFYAVFTENLKGITLVSRESDGGAIVQILTGTTNHDLREYCVQNGFSYPGNTVIDTLTLGGVVSTGSYGTGWDVHPVADYLTEIRIVDYHGNLRTFSVNDEDQEAWKAAKMSLGLFGIVYDFKFKLNPMYHARVTHRKHDIEDLLFGNDGQDFANLFKQHYSCRVFWYPFTDTLYVKTIDITDEPLTSVSATQQELQTLTEYIQQRIGATSAQLLKRYGWLTPRFWRTQYELFFPENSNVVLLTDAIHFQKFSDDVKLTFLELGWNVTTNDDMRDMAEAFHWVIEKTYDYSEMISRDYPRGMYPLNIALEFHCVGNSDSTLSLGTGNPKTCCIEIMSDVGTPNWERFLQDVLNRWVQMSPQRATRLHWAKVNPKIKNVVSILRNEYKPQIQAFEAVRRRLDVDSVSQPIFANSFMQQVIMNPF